MSTLRVEELIGAITLITVAKSFVLRGIILVIQTSIIPPLKATIPHLRTVTNSGGINSPFIKVRTQNPDVHESGFDSV